MYESIVKNNDCYLYLIFDLYFCYIFLIFISEIPIRRLLERPWKSGRKVRGNGAAGGGGKGQRGKTAGRHDFIGGKGWKWRNYLYLCARIQNNV